MSYVQAVGTVKSLRLSRKHFRLMLCCQQIPRFVREISTRTSLRRP